MLLSAVDVESGSDQCEKQILVDHLLGTLAETLIAFLEPYLLAYGDVQDGIVEEHLALVA